MDMSKTIEILDEVEDVITGFKGTVTAKITYVYGCTQFEVKPKHDGKGDYPKSAWIDEPQLKIIKKNGGDQSEPRNGGMRSHP